jgi:hypothetical protein
LQGLKRFYIAERDGAQVERMSRQLVAEKRALVGLASDRRGRAEVGDLKY